MEEENNVDPKSELRGQGCHGTVEPFCLPTPVPPRAEKHWGGQQMPSATEGHREPNPRVQGSVLAGRDDSFRDRHSVKHGSNFLPLAASCERHSNCPSFLWVFLAPASAEVHCITHSSPRLCASIYIHIHAGRERSGSTDSQELTSCWSVGCPLLPSTYFHRLSA